jgi:surface protein
MRFGLGLEYSKLSGGGSGYNAFTIEVKTDNAGTSNDNQFQFTGGQGDYDVVAKQGGIIVETFSDLSDAATITFSNGVGTYILEVTPKAANGFNRIQFDNKGDHDKILDTKNWGNIVWSTFNSAFNGCINMTVTATDVPNLSSVTNMSKMFEDATSANPDTSNWDVSSVADMSLMFAFASSANPDTSNWDVSSVTNMRLMFYKASSANPDVSNWDVSSVTDMRYMFSSATLANPDVSNWDVSSVTDMRYMFNNSNLSEENLTLIYENWSQLQLQQNMEFTAGTTKYNSSGQAGRDILVNTYNWTIEDGGQV